ncbi:MAG: carbamoyltransferase HypF [Bacteroidetes bacterium]|nr:carbamoyltransferase HypF [Bacteroidota bacterium]
MSKSSESVNNRIHVKGLVQGVGFRPFIYRLAIRFGLLGWVENRNDGVFIKVEGSQETINDFIDAIRNEAPQASNVVSIDTQNITLENFTEFSIIKSENTSDDVTDVSPDICVCNECIDDLKTQDHRIDYPFINCTNCGPRFTIIKDLPYDRGMTTMAPFIMCEQCNSEYTEILDRRFHAQPVACNTCGPIYSLHQNGSKTEDFQEVVKECASLLDDGKLVAMKGMGGYHLACNAVDEEAVKKLRIAKNRDGKPFAIMARNLNSLKTYVAINIEEENHLTSWQRPIVLLKDLKKLAPSVSVGFESTGAMLPYMPFHFLLFEKMKTDVIVLTSGNISDEPIIIDNKKAIDELGSFCDAVLTYNRDIHNRTDDSASFVTNNKGRLIRRSRGFTPTPTRLNQNVDGIFAAGAELVNCFCVGKGQQAILSQHIGDLKNLETLEFYSESAERFKHLFRVKPELAVYDMHPDYLSTKYAKSLNIPGVAVQHHHAHIASCMAEHQLDEKVIGIALDGVGYGDDGKIWGGEFFVCDLADYDRVTYFDYAKMPGGDKATKHPWRMALSYLHKVYGKSVRDYLELDFLKDVPEFEINLILDMLEKNINTPLTSSTGRLFDAMSALLNICTKASFHAEAPMRLEAECLADLDDHFEYDIQESICLDAMFEEVVMSLNKGIDRRILATKFHNTIINIIFAFAKKMRAERGLDKVVLSGGSFQNRYILERTENLLIENGFKVYSHLETPANDGSLSLGQLVIAAKKRELGQI